MFVKVATGSLLIEISRMLSLSRHGGLLLCSHELSGCQRLGVETTFLYRTVRGRGICEIKSSSLLSVRAYRPWGERCNTSTSSPPKSRQGLVHHIHSLLLPITLVPDHAGIETPVSATHMRMFETAVHPQAVFRTKGTAVTGSSPQFWWVQRWVGATFVFVIENLPDPCGREAFTPG